MQKNKKYKLFPYAARWVIWSYGLLALILIPWTINLAYSLPARTLARHWDIAWVGLDIFLISSLVANAVFAVYRSKFLVMSLITTTTLLFIDAWLDVMSAKAGKPLVLAITEALIFELPLAIISFSVALGLIDKLKFKPKD